MELVTSRVDDRVVVRLQEKRLDAASAPKFKSAIESELTKDEKRIVLDLSEVTFMDSSGLGAVVAVLKQLNGGEIRVVGLQKAVKELFRLTRMDRIFQCHETVDSAMES
ncbi:STAS domain-containing protein [uncultured Ferrimonas sp.]|uniref:STAS domain-containing protein n=1 Tax=uncultured Ferrimonas sp. TaxID=432640 RepID=UPI00261F167B|nr:STAS domain-containing protein [uncultured Ferrimonas sp.]